MQEHPTKNRDSWIAFWTAVLLLVTAILIVTYMTHGCSVAPKTEVQPAPQVPQPPAPPPPPPTCDGSELGSTRKVDCPAGQTGDTYESCTATGWKQVSSTCAGTLPDCDTVTTFDELAPVIALNCVSCHAGFDTYDLAKTKNAKMVDYIQREADAVLHMPAGRPKLSAHDIDLFKTWASGGFLNAGQCKGTPPPPPPTFRDFPWLEETLESDVSRVDTADKPVTRWLVAIDQVNLGRSEALTEAFKAANKAVNSISVERPQLFPLTVVAPGVWRINNINDLGIQDAEWKLIEASTQLNFESFTQRGRALKDATKSRLPWMFVQDFNDTVLRNAAVYYKLTEAPATLQQLQQNLGVDFGADLLAGKALLLGFNGSALSPAANRLMSRHDSRDGVFWATYDTGAIVSDAQNVHKNPLLVEAGGKANLKFAAGEQLYTLPNGLIGSFLADAQGKRLDEADPKVVHDFTSNPVSPIIKNAISCFRCHSGGFIHATDSVRVGISGSGIGPDDIQRALKLFKIQTTVDQLFTADNQNFSSALSRLGISPQDPDPISKVSDRFLGDLTLADVAALFIQTPEDMTTCINLSPNGQQQVGQLLVGGTVSHDQLVPVVKDLIRDCRFFQDPL